MQPPMIETLRKRLTDREHPARLHLIGVAGSGMSGLALMLMEMGHRVSGCDRVTSAETERLQSLGLSFSCPHSADAVSDAEIVIYSSAIRADNPALAAARKLNIPCSAPRGMPGSHPEPGRKGSWSPVRMEKPLLQPSART